MNKDVSSKNKNSNILIKIGITYIIPIFLAILGAVFISVYGWNELYSKFLLTEGNFTKKVERTQVDRATVTINDKLIYRPFTGENIGQLKVSSLGIEQDIFETNTPRVLVKGAAHSTRSYLPGEGGHCVLNSYSSNQLSKLENVQEGTEIILETSYGKYYYEVVDTTIINKDEEKSFINYYEKDEKLSIVIEYPFNSIGETMQKYLITCKFVKVE